MRFVLAIAAFVVAAAMIITGIAQRTVFLGPPTQTVDVKVSGELPYTVIDGTTLNANPGQQTVTLAGSSKAYLAYGRTSDVKAWLGESKYNLLTLDDENKLVSDVVTPKPAETSTGSNSGDEASTDADATSDVTDPAGSDLWLGEFTEDRALIAPMSVPDDVSVLIASDGSEPAPSTVKLSWPLDNATPWAGPLIVGGIILLAVGLVLYLLGLRHMRRSRGPRRKSLPPLDDQKRLPRAPKARRPKAARRNALIAVIPVALVSSLALSGCSPSFWPQLPAQSATPTSTSTDAAATDDSQPAPVVSVPQIERIVSKISAVVADADEQKSADVAATRLTGPALDERKANYQIRSKNADAQATAAIPASPITLTLPQASDTWPRTVMTVIQDADDTSVAPTLLVLTQETPRANYLIDYSVRLEPQAQIPDVAPATIGASQIPPDSSFLLLAPDKIAEAYADVLANGDSSQYAAQFAAEGDTLRTQVSEDREKKKADLPDTASIEFATKAGSGPALALATNDSGAIIAVNVTDSETVKPVEEGASVKTSGAVASLSGLTETKKGVTSTYGDQLLFYVPPTGSTDKIRLLGFSQGLVSATELP
ncbi:hypothetical protein [Okibacterium fritillariae]|uniref:DUF8094 domain-containing protein n=1 Tax=Okibacterium fritillariae TaxID=123320 RepID=A0A1T5J7L4_9MICO|nr:hypothetical protein [Okibacterium fritillariae]SKC47359.1 hypothetical protein SAMN06309945_1304 [Okibacterium fritillariae]